MEFQNPNPSQPNPQGSAPGQQPPTTAPTSPIGGGAPNAAPAQPASPSPQTPPANTSPQQPQVSNMQSAPLFTDMPGKKSNSAIIVLVIVIVLVVAAGVIFFLMARKPATTPTSPVVDAQPSGVTDSTNNGAFGEQQASNREVGASADVTSELNEINAELDALNIDSFEEEFAEIDKLLNDISL